MKNIKKKNTKKLNKINKYNKKTKKKYNIYINYFQVLYFFNELLLSDITRDFKF